MSHLKLMEATSLETLPSPTSLLDKLPIGVKGIIAAVALGVSSGCTVIQYRTHPTDENLQVTPNGGLYYNPTKNLGRRPIQSEVPISRSFAGAGIGYVACRVLGVSPTSGIGCAIVGGLVGSQSYDSTEMDRQDYEQLQWQIVQAYKSGISAAPKIIDNNTRHVGLVRKGMIGNVYHIRFKVQEVNGQGRVVRLYFVHATLKSGVQGNNQPLQIIDPLPFPNEKEFPLR